MQGFIKDCFGRIAKKPDYIVTMYKITGTGGSITCSASGNADNNYESFSASKSVDNTLHCYSERHGTTGNAVEGNYSINGRTNYTDGTFTCTGLWCRSTKNYGTETGTKGVGYYVTIYYYATSKTPIVKKMTKKKYQKFVQEQTANKTYVYNAVAI